jgi:hypothetical protein
MKQKIVPGETNAKKKTGYDYGYLYAVCVQCASQQPGAERTVLINID